MSLDHKNEEQPKKYPPVTEIEEIDDKQFASFEVKQHSDSE